MAEIRKYLPTLSIVDDDVAILGFNFQAATGSIGAKADVTPLNPNLTINRGDDITLTLRTPFGDAPKKHLIKNGTVAGSSHTTRSARAAGLTVATDALSLVAIDSISYRWKLAPRVPLIVYDPALVVLQANETDTNVNDEDGAPIVADTLEVEGLDLEQLLQLVYVDKCGFDELITNIPTYAIPRMDFSLSSSWHGIISSEYAKFKPVVYEDDNRLFIIDVAGEIPAEILAGARDLEISKYLTATVEQPEAQLVNAILLSHKEISAQTLTEDEFPANVTFRIDEDPADVVGTILDDDYRSTTFKRYVAEIHDDEDDLAKITSEVVYKVETQTTGKDDEGTIRVLATEVQTDHYSNSWRLKLGYQKTVTAYIEDGSGGKFLQDVLTETNTLTWRAAPSKPGEYEKLRSQTQVEGLVLIEGDEDEEIRTPLLDASNNKIVPDDGSATISRLPISSNIEVWRYTGADQIEVHRQKMNQLTGRLESSGTVEHVGTNNVRVRTGESFNNKQVLIVDEASDLADGPREPAPFDAGFVGYAIAKELALRELDFLRNPREIVRAELASFDGGIGRGSIRNLIDRDGNSKTVIIIGFQVEGLPVKMTIEGVVVA